jgi:hypothetical protein
MPNIPLFAEPQDISNLMQQLATEFSIAFISLVPGKVDAEGLPFWRVVDEISEWKEGIYPLWVKKAGPLGNPPKKPPS